MATDLTGWINSPKVYTYYPGGSGYFQCKAILLSQNLINNTSLIRISTRYVCTYFYGSHTAYSTTSIDDGSITSQGDVKAIYTTGIYNLLDYDKTITHNADGSKCIDFRAGGYLRISGANGSTKYSPWTEIALPTIPRGSIITTPIAGFDYTIGNNLTVNVTKSSPGYTDRLTIKIAGTTVYTDTAFTSQTISFSAGVIAAMYNALPSSNNGTMTVEIDTYSGTTFIADTSVSGTAYVTNSNPVFNNYTYADINTATVALTGNNQNFIQGYSKARITISTVNKAVAQNGATMVNYIVNIGTLQKTGAYSASATVNIDIDYPIVGTIQVYAVDSRGNQTLVSKSATLVTYSDVVITSFTEARDNNVDEETKIIASGTFSHKNFGSVTNTISATYEYKQTSSGTWLTGSTSLSVTVSGDDWNIDQYILGDTANGFDAAKSFNIRLNVEDELITKQQSIVISKGEPYFLINSDGSCTANELHLRYDPTDDDNATTKKYVDRSLGKGTNITGSSIGWLIKTDLAYNADIMFNLKLSGNGYSKGLNVFAVVEGYNYHSGTAIINTHGFTLGVPSEIDVFIYDSVICFYVPHIQAYSSVNVFVSWTVEGDSINHVTSITRVAKPTTGISRNVAVDLDDFNSARQQMVFGGNYGYTLPAGATGYFGHGYNAGPYHSGFAFPVAGTISKLKVYSGGSPGPLGQSYTTTIMNNDIATPITATILTGTNSAVDNIHSVHIDAGARITLKWVNSSGASLLTSLTFGFVFVPD